MHSLYKFSCNKTHAQANVNHKSCVWVFVAHVHAEAAEVDLRTPVFAFHAHVSLSHPAQFARRSTTTLSERVRTQQISRNDKHGEVSGSMSHPGELRCKLK